MNFEKLEKLNTIPDIDFNASYSLQETVITSAPVTEEQAEAICRAYKMAKERYGASFERTAECIAGMRKARTPCEEQVLIKRMNLISEQLTRDNLYIQLFELALCSLSEAEQNVIYSLYGEGRKWTEIENPKNGKPLSSNAIASLKRSGMQKLTEHMGSWYKEIKELEATPDVVDFVPLSAFFVDVLPDNEADMLCTAQNATSCDAVQ